MTTRIDQHASAEEVRQTVREGYAAVATADAPSAAPKSSSSSCCGSGGCCGGSTMTVESIAESVGYSADELAAIPEGANMGLSCGNPGAIAALKGGEVVLDLGCGGGFDVFLAGPRVGANGHVIGVDMTAEMLGKSRRNAVSYRERTALDNVEFRLGEIEHLPVADSSVDVVISNCVINLSPDKPQVWHEIARVLKPGGRVAVSDLALLQPLPKAIREMVEALVGCIAGAVLIDDTRRMMREAGLSEIRLTPKPEYVRALESFQDPLYAKIAAELPNGARVTDYITSLDIAAVKLRQAE